MKLPLINQADLADREFNKISALVYGIAGIRLPDHKRELVKARLGKRLRELGLNSYRQYVAHLEADKSGRELINMLDAISTNLTSFFREPVHFKYMNNEIIPEMLKKTDKKIRIWSAGCSTGEEPYTIGIYLETIFPNLDHWDAKILATDINTTVLDYARKGEYTELRLKDIALQVRREYFDCIKQTPPRMYRVKKKVKNLVSFARLNLLDRWPMQGSFDIIFCRNVMIYFDKQTQKKLVNRFWEMLRPGGTLFIGHSESLTGTEHKFKYQQPTIYRKKQTK